MTTRVPVRFTYEKDGTVPPVYVAGTFSDPAWQPFEMDVSTNENGQNVFSKVIDVSDASDIQYKFRIGSENWWLCNETAETVTDDQGNINNILRVPSRQPDTTSETPDQVDRTDSSSPPLSPTGAASEIEPEASNTAGKLNIDDSAPDSGSASSHTEPLQPNCPMFSHERVAFPDEDATFDDPSEDLQSPLDDYQPHKQSETKQHEYAEDPDIDLNDPALERFPSDSASIMATIRRLSTSVNEDRTFPQGRAPSLVVDPFKSSTDDLPEAQSLAVPPADQPRTDGKNSFSASAGSVSSLNSIAESDDEPTNDEQGDTTMEGFTPVIQHPAAIRAQPGVADSKGDGQGDGPGSEDEGIAMCNVARQRPAEGNLDRANSLIPEPVGFTRRPPSHIVEPVLQSSTPIPEEDRIDSAEISANGLAINHVRAISPHIVISSPSTDGSNDSNQNTVRKGNADRPISRTSMNSIQDVKGGANWLQVFIHMLLVDWVGGFLSRLWHGGRTA